MNWNNVIGNFLNYFFKQNNFSRSLMFMWLLISVLCGYLYFVLFCFLRQKYIKIATIVSPKYFKDEGIPRCIASSIVITMPAMLTNSQMYSNILANVFIIMV